MAKQTISGNQLHNLKNGSLLDFGTDTNKFKEVVLTDLKDTLAYVGSKYRLFIADEKLKAVKAGSAKSSERITVSDVSESGNVLSIEVLGDEYLKFISEGVDGWGGPSKGGKYKFKGKGVPKSMLESVEEWLGRKANKSRVEDQTTRKSISDSAGKRAFSAAFMIKRQGIAPKHFLEKAKALTAKVAEEEFGKALKVDIINNLTA